MHHRNECLTKDNASFILHEYLIVFLLNYESHMHSFPWLILNLRYDIILLWNTTYLYIYWRPFFKLRYVSKVIMPIMSLHHVKWLGISSIYFNDEKESHFVLKTIFLIIHERTLSLQKKFITKLFLLTGMISVFTLASIGIHRYDVLW